MDDDLGMWPEWRALSYSERQLARLEAIDNQIQKGIRHRTALLELERESLRREIEILHPYKEWL